MGSAAQAVLLQVLGRSGRFEDEQRQLDSPRTSALSCHAFTPQVKQTWDGDQILEPEHPRVIRTPVKPPLAWNRAAI